MQSAWERITGGGLLDVVATTLHNYFFSSSSSCCHLLFFLPSSYRRRRRRRRRHHQTTAGLSEDSDYTSEVNYPASAGLGGGHYQANGSASQYLSVAGQYPSPQPVDALALAAMATAPDPMSRQNSYEITDPTTWDHQWSNYDAYDAAYYDDTNGYHPTVS